VEPFSGNLDQFSSIYQGKGRGRDINMTVENITTTIRVRNGGRPFDTLEYVGDYRWKMGSTFYEFREVTGEYNELRINQISGYYVLEKQ
jgi:hypothetical protein